MRGAFDKTRLRKSLKTKRAALSKEARDQHSARAAQHLLNSDFFDVSQAIHKPTVALFAAFRDEADPRTLEAPLRARGWRLAYPRVEGDTLRFYLGALSSLLPAPPWNIPEPRAEFHQPVEVQALHRLVVPGLGFSKSGARIGYGRGFYDRTLGLLRGAGEARAVGFAFSCQLVSDIPTDPHDQRVDAWTTELGYTALATP